MADAKITSLAALAADPANNDMFVIVDVSDTSMASTGTDKKLAASYLMKSSGASAGATSQAQAFTRGLILGASGVSGVQLSLLDSAGGYYAEFRGSYADSNLAIGTSALAANTTGGANLAFGPGALYSNTVGNNNTAFGLNALLYNTSGTGNVAVNRNALFSNTTGGDNVALGLNTLYSNLSGAYNSAIGGGAMVLNTVGNANVAIGLNSLSANTSGSYNMAIGSNALGTNTSGSYNIAVGYGLNAPSATADYQLVIGSYIVGDGSAIAIKPRANSTAAILFQNAAASTIAAIDTTDSATAAIVNRVSLIGTSSGTPGAGFGSAIRAGLKSSTTANQDAGRLSWAWSTATHATRAAVGKLTAYYTSTEREAITWTADGTGVTVAIPNGPLTTGEIRATGAAGVKLTDSSGVLGVHVAPSGAVSVGNTTGITAFNVLDGTTSKGLLVTPLFGGSAYLFAYDIPGTTHIPFVLRANTFDLQTGTSSTTSRLTISASGEIRGNYDTNSTAYFGRCAIGYNGSTSDVASFGHIDMNTSANIALFQTAAGASWFNCASGQNLIFARGGFSLGQWDTSGNLHPAVDNTVDCGKSGSRWNDIWASNATIQTSDQRDKRALQPSALGLDFVKALQPVSWVWADKGKRPHYGFIAQQVKQAMDAVGVDDFAGYIYDEETDSYSLRYSEFLSPIVKALQELLQRVERLEGAN